MAHVRRRMFITPAAAALVMPRDALAQAPTTSAERRLRDLGIVLAKVRAFVANHVSYARMNILVFLPGVGPLQPDGTFATGKVGADVVVEEADEHARPTCLVLPAAMCEATGGLNRVARAGKMFGMVNAPPGFTDYPRAIAFENAILRGCEFRFDSGVTNRRRCESIVQMPRDRANKFLRYNCPADHPGVINGCSDLFVGCSATVGTTPARPWARRPCRSNITAEIETAVEPA